MITLQGKGVFGGIAIGEIAFFKRDSGVVQRKKVEDPQAELARAMPCFSRHISSCWKIWTM